MLSVFRLVIFFDEVIPLQSNLDPIGIRTKIPIDCIYFEPSLDSQVINGYLEAVSNNEGSASVQHQILSDTTTSTSSNSDNEVSL